MAAVCRADDGLDRPPLPLLPPPADAGPPVHRDGHHRRAAAWRRRAPPRLQRREHPVALQLGGSEPASSAHCARLAREWGYDEINLNCGCPSERVQRGAFGACLMAEPALVADCVQAMRERSRSAGDRQAPHRHRPHRELRIRARLRRHGRRGGCDVFIVHARNAWLHGISPKENRECRRCAMRSSPAEAGLPGADDRHQWRRHRR